MRVRLTVPLLVCAWWSTAAQGQITPETSGKTSFKESHATSRTHALHRQYRHRAAAHRSFGSRQIR